MTSCFSFVKSWQQTLRWWHCEIFFFEVLILSSNTCHKVNISFILCCLETYSKKKVNVSGKFCSFFSRHNIKGKKKVLRSHMTKLVSIWRPNTGAQFFYYFFVRQCNTGRDCINYMNFVVRSVCPYLLIVFTVLYICWKKYRH